jgi:hypothetical protein
MEEDEDEVAVDDADSIVDATEGTLAVSLDLLAEVVDMEGTFPFPDITWTAGETISSASMSWRDAGPGRVHELLLMSMPSKRILWPLDELMLPAFF